MKTTIKAKVIFETDRFTGTDGRYPLTLVKIKEVINGNKYYDLEWINSDLTNEQEPTLIIRDLKNSK